MSARLFMKQFAGITLGVAGVALAFTSLEKISRRTRLPLYRYNGEYNSFDSMTRIRPMEIMEPVDPILGAPTIYTNNFVSEPLINY